MLIMVQLYINTLTGIINNTITIKKIIIQCGFKFYLLNLYFTYYMYYFRIVTRLWFWEAISTVWFWDDFSNLGKHLVFIRKLFYSSPLHTQLCPLTFMSLKRGSEFRCDSKWGENTLLLFIYLSFCVRKAELIFNKSNKQ